LLRRPLRFQGLPKTGHQLKKPMLFVSHCVEDFEGVPDEISGGPLEFDAYLMWAPKIVPREHQGSLIRIRGASGTLFDPTFMRYQVAEQTRLRQISCEIFVRRGLEGALNIDRESLNHAHPHAVYLTRWLHNALRRLASTQKRVAAEARNEARRVGEETAEAVLEHIVDDAWRTRADDEGQSPPAVIFVAAGDEGIDYPAEERGGYQFRRDAVFPGSPRPATSAEAKRVERQLRAIVQLLAAYHLLEPLSPDDQEELLAYLRKVLQEEDG